MPKAWLGGPMTDREPVPQDRLEEIRRRYAKPPTVWDASVQADVRWLVAEVERLRGCQ